MSSFDMARFNMVESQVRPNGVTDRRLLEAMLQVRRELFLPETSQNLAYADSEIPAGRGRMLAAPMVFARLVQLAEVRPEDRVLMIGDGAGYGAAVLAHMAAFVVSLDSDPELAASAKRNLTDCANVVTVEGPLAEGCRKHQPYNVIIFEGRVPAVSDAIFAQLADGGRIVVAEGDGDVVSAHVWSVSNGTRSLRTGFNVSASLLPGFAARAPEFVF
jgi:protein-L-isoaspartate(D-aspartate) O-methyltransferase